MSMKRERKGNLLYSKTMFVCMCACGLSPPEQLDTFCYFFCLLGLGQGVVLGPKNPDPGSGVSRNTEKLIFPPFFNYII